MGYTVREKLDEWYDTNQEEDFDEFVGAEDFDKWANNADDSDCFDCTYCLGNFGSTGCSLEIDEGYEEED